MGYNIKRRKIIKKIVTIVTGFISISFISRFLSYKSSNKIKEFRIPKKKVSPNSAVVYPDKKIALVNINNQLFALDLTCTHLGCTVQINKANIVCPCHGSIFSHDGRLIKGPAKRNLRIYKVIEDGDFFIVKV